MPKFKIGQLVSVWNAALEQNLSGRVISCDDETVVVNANLWTESWVAFYPIGEVQLFVRPEGPAEGAAPNVQAEAT